MSSPRPQLGHHLVLALLTALTCWLTLSSWRGLTEAADGWLTRVAVAGLVVCLTGALMRSSGLPRWLVLVVQLALAVAATTLTLTGSPLPVGRRWDSLIEAFADAIDTIGAWAPPIPQEGGTIAPVLLGGGLLIVVLVDFLAGSLARVPLAGIALLAAYTIPVGILGDVPWLVFGASALGFLALLYVQERASIGRWGQAIDPAAGEAAAGDGRPRSAAFRGSALGTALIATAGAVLIGGLVPTMGQRFQGFGPGPGGDDKITVDNPMVDLRRDLVRGEDVDVVSVVTDDPDPAYLRLSVLTRFTDGEWSPGDRSLPEENTSRGDLPEPIGVDPAVRGRDFSYQLAATSAFQSTWLPLFSQATSVDAPGDWRFDPNTRDFMTPGGDAEELEGMHWEQSATKLQYDTAIMQSAPSASGLVSSDYLDLPDGYPQEAIDLAREVTDGTRSAYERAVQLQRWFQVEGGFVYDTEAALGNGTDDLMSFLAEGEGGRRGYCEQFAAAMASMGRSLGIPSRVAVGFLRPEQTGDQEWVYSTHDLHAWPEMFIPGSGWVAFEPTPTSHTRTVPDYSNPRLTDDPSTGESDSSSAPTSSDSAGPSPSASLPEPTRRPQQAEEQAAGEEEGSFPWTAVVAGVLVVGLVLLIAVLPALLRRARRGARRRSGGPEEAWSELRDTAVDLGLPWPGDGSPRTVRQRLVSRVGRAGCTDPRPRQHPDEHPEAAAALQRLAELVERSRYARPGSSSSTEDLWTDVDLVTQGWTGGAPSEARRRARWWPRSLWRRGPAPAPRADSVEGDDSESTMDRVG